MSAHFDKDVRPSGTLSRVVARNALAAALQAAAEAADAAFERDDRAEAVHDVRKAFKQLRGLLRLVRGAHRREARHLRAEIGAAARTLSGPRDEVVRRETLDRLAAKGRLSLRACRSARAALTGGPAPEERPAPVAELRGLVARCTRVATRLAESAGRDMPVAALAADYTRARRRGRSVVSGDDADMHELRKAVIAHRYQMELLTPCWPALGKPWVKQLQKLRDRLGHHHDLAMLVAAVAAEGSAGTGWRAEVAAAARARQARLAARALRLHARLFAERPKAFARRIRAYAKASGADG
ncbi:CHAD domain-containing protein [Ancylobacter oerskovii]|uniref:CHAD domain-containing protein n=1 Tax=Ancylobacter oerskovii TaxID=459519 RepID=A0ABW4YYS3_9HYPH|nr:CHAD domain-containing protein [Ancylobacter oerskovii]MBS7541626.1 CHAD domain-containing protein [Ancylobacter oerskovii]